MPRIWRDGKEIQGTAAEFIAQLRAVAAQADKEWMISSSWHAHIGDWLNKAADELEKCSL